MLPNLICYDFFINKVSHLEHLFWKLCNICRKIYVAEFNIKEVAVCRVAMEAVILNKL